MFIRFHCPVCEHRLRVHHSAAGKQSQCKCGAVIAVPNLRRPRPTQQRNDDYVSVPYVRRRIEERIPAAHPSRQVGRPSPLLLGRKRFRQGVLVGSSAVLAVVFLAAICGLSLQNGRSIGAEPQPADDPLARRASEGSSSDNRSAAIKTETHPSAGIKKVESPRPAIKKEEQSALAAVPDKKKPQKTISAAQPATQKAVPPKPPLEPKPAVKIAAKMEIVEWYTAAKFSVVGDSGKTEMLFLDESALQSGCIFVAVKVRMPARMLAGRSLSLPDADTKLLTAQKDLAAIGCSMPGGQWFAPEKGQFSYAPQGDEVLQSWLFEANVNDLETGCVQFQFGDQPTEALTLNLRVKGT